MCRSGMWKEDTSARAWGEIKGEQHLLQQGQRVPAEHPAVKAHPELFEMGNLKRLARRGEGLRSILAARSLQLADAH